jgi:hypothetical protein
MRLILEIVIAAALIALSWNKSFKEWASEAPIIGANFTAPAQAPQIKSPVAPATSATPTTAFTGHVYYTDEQGKSYWLDAQGKRHYKP